MNGLIGMLIKQKIAGKVVGLLASKTQWGVSSVTIVALSESLPAALAGDDAAIGRVVVAVGGWLLALYGRLKVRWS